MNENRIKGHLVARLKRRLQGAVILPHQDLHTAGVPDLSITWHGWTTWIECKRLTKRAPRIKAKAVQTLRAVELAQQGRCFYVIWDQRDLTPRTAIVSPQVVWSCQTDKIDIPESLFLPGYDHEAVAEMIRITHQT